MKPKDDVKLKKDKDKVKAKVVEKPVEEPSEDEVLATQQKVRLLILCKEVSREIEMTVQFLIRRDWDVLATTSIKTAIETVVKDRPTHVMVSFQHPNPKVIKLPPILSSTFNITSIGFLEKDNTSLRFMLQGSGLKYTLFPPINGPSVFRYIKKIQVAELQGAQAGFETNESVVANSETEKNQSIAADDDKSEMIERLGQARVPGSGIKKPQSGVVMVESKTGSSVENKGGMSSAITGKPLEAGANNKMMEMMSMLLGDEGSIDSGDVKPDLNTLANQIDQVNQLQQGKSNGSKAPGMMMFTDENKKKEKGPGIIIQQGEKRDHSSRMAPMGESESPKSGHKTMGGMGVPDPNLILTPNAQQQTHRDPNNIMLPDHKNKSGSNNVGTMGSGSADGKQKGHTGPIGHQEHDSKDPKTIMQQGHRGKAGGFEGQQDKDGGAKGAAYMPQHQRKDKSHGPAAQQDKKKSDKVFIKTEIERPTHSPQMEIIKEAAQKALDRTVLTYKNKKPELVQEVKSTTNIMCITVDCDRFRGYLVCAAGADIKLDGKFLEVIQERLFRFLVEQGENLKQDELMDIKVQPVEFKDWALEYAEFLRTSIHKGKEIAMAFFPKQDVAPVFEASAEEHMVQVSVESIKPDVPTAFNIYLYMPQNKKYFLYCRKGNSFASERKDRLQDMGVDSLHIRKDEVKDYKGHRAQSYLNDTIEEFKQRKEAGIDKKKAS